MIPGHARVAGHFGELVQGRLGPSGPVALITLPCPVLAATATCRAGAFRLHQPGAGSTPRRQVLALLDRLGLPRRGAFTLRLQMPPGGGAGASTAALMALAKAAGARDPQAITAACLAVEGASDPLLFAAPERLVWASRQGRVLGQMPPLPRMELIGGFTGTPERTDPADNNFPDISDLLQAWPRACGRLEEVARLISLSAGRTLALRGAAADPTAALARRLGALGYTIAHTGSARALIFAPGTVPEAAATDLRAAGFSTITRFRIGGR